MRISCALLAAGASLALFADPAHAACTEEIAGVEKELAGGQAPEASEGEKVAEALARAKAAAAENDEDACMDALEEARELAGQEDTKDS